MPRILALAIAVSSGMTLVLACGQSTPGAAAASDRPKAATGPANSGNACDRKLLTAADAAGILSDPITGSKPIPGDPQSCKFITATYWSITVMLRPGMGRTTVETWKSGRMPVAAVPLAGVGDDAAWVDDLHEVVAEKNDLLCDVQVMGFSTPPRGGSTAAQQKAIGGLCNTIFGRVK